MSLDYFAQWIRNSDPSEIDTWNAPRYAVHRETLQNHLAGTTTLASAKLTDVLFGYQVLAGVDYRVSDPVTIGLKFRWADFGEFESDPREWDQLRSHESALGPGGGRVDTA